MRSPITFVLLALNLILSHGSPTFAQPPVDAPASQSRSPGAIQVRSGDGSLAWYEPAVDGSGVYEPSRTPGETSTTQAKSSWAPGLFLFGLIGQAMFMGRFALQWIASERRGRSVVPLGFWWLSFAGATILLTYFAIQAEPIGVLGQLLGWPIYLRNIHMVRRDRRTGRFDPVDPAAHPIADPNAEA